MPCGCVQPIKRGLVEEKRWRKRIKGKRNRERKEDLVASTSDFRRSDGQSSKVQRSEFIEPRVKVRLLDEGYTPRGRDSS